ncbi:MAG: hypothetical protein LLG04_03160 [Parachlamydia sp.]|nr:hypothetical protein [Parachlamydia sp.]
MMVNLVERVNADTSANGAPLPDPIPPKELIERIMALGSALGSEEMNDFRKLPTSKHALPGFMKRAGIFGNCEEII